MTNELLEQLAALMRCSYLSDVHSRSVEDLLQAVGMINVERYTPEEWSKALTYITHNEFTITDVGQLKSSIADRLGHK